MKKNLWRLRMTARLVGRDEADGVDGGIVVEADGGGILVEAAGSWISKQQKVF